MILNPFIDSNFIENLRYQRNDFDYELKADIININSKLCENALSVSGQYGKINAHISSILLVDKLEQLGYSVKKTGDNTYDISFAQSAIERFDCKPANATEVYTKLVGKIVNNIINDLRKSDKVCIEVVLDYNQLQNDVIKVLKESGYYIKKYPNINYFDISLLPISEEDNNG